MHSLRPWYTPLLNLLSAASIVVAVAGLAFALKGFRDGQIAVTLGGVLLTACGGVLFVTASHLRGRVEYPHLGGAAKRDDLMTIPQDWAPRAEITAYRPFNDEQMPELPEFHSADDLLALIDGRN